MHLRPPYVHRNVCHPPTPRICGMDCFQIRVLYGVGDGDPILDAYTPVIHVEIYPKAMGWSDGICPCCSLTNFLEICVFWIYTCHERAREYFRKGKIDGVGIKIVRWRWCHCGCLSIWCRRWGRYWWGCKCACSIGKANFGWGRLLYLQKSFLIVLRHHQKVLKPITYLLKIFGFFIRLIGTAI